MILEKSILINAIPAKVWQVFTNPAITRGMGGEYVSDWKVGSSFGWKGADGKMYTQGVILQIVPNKLLRHHLFNPDGHTVLSTITYELQDRNGNTLLLAKEEPVESYEDASAGWDAALRAVKDLAEAL